MARVIIILLAQNPPMPLFYTCNKNQKPLLSPPRSSGPSYSLQSQPHPASGSLYPLFPLLISCFPKPGSLQHFLLLLLEGHLLRPLRSFPLPARISISNLAFISFLHLSLWLCAMYLYVCYVCLPGTYLASIITCWVCVVKLYLYISKFNQSSNPMA